MVFLLESFLVALSLNNPKYLMDHWPLLNALEYQKIGGFGIIGGLENSPETNNREGGVLEQLAEGEEGGQGKK